MNTEEKTQTKFSSDFTFLDRYGNESIAYEKLMKWESIERIIQKEEALAPVYFPIYRSLENPTYFLNN